ncbi:hypothetical protein TNCV_3587451 [Trichonephila clavipes]|nr:hypothetical protein TNCV_3587451 [Trichonephila clavipes]
MLPAWPKWIVQPRHEPLIKNLSRLQDNNCLHEQFEDVCSSMDSQLGDHGYSTFDCCPGLHVHQIFHQ